MPHKLIPRMGLARRPIAAMATRAKPSKPHKERWSYPSPATVKGEFEPILVPKHQRRLSGLDEKILGLYSRGMSTRDISAQLKELYGANISASLISEVTDAVTEEVQRWQSRPLDALYPIAYLDALYVNIRVAGRVSKRAIYVVLGIDLDGHKTLLGSLE